MNGSYKQKGKVLIQKLIWTSSAEWNLCQQRQAFENCTKTRMNYQNQTEIVSIDKIETVNNRYGELV